MKFNWKRAKKRTTETATIRSWESKCNRYKVEESVSRYGLSTVYRAMTFDGRIISTHRKKRPAIHACEKHFAYNVDCL